MRTLAIVVGTLVVLWLAFVVLLAVARPDTGTIKEAMRLLPDTIRLVRRLASDRDVPWSARVLVWLLLGYLALPVDLVPDVIPVLGYADDLIISALVLRHLARRAGADKLTEHWPGDAAGLRALRTLLRV